MRDSCFPRCTHGEMQHWTDASSNVTWRPSRARRTAIAPVPHPRSSASNDLWPAGERPTNWQSEVDAQSALGRLEVGGVLRCAGTEPLEVVIGGHFLRALRTRSRPVRVAVKRA